MKKVSRGFLSAQPVGARLVAHWSFSEGKGNRVADQTGNGHDLTAYNDPKWFALDDKRVAILLDGRSQYLEADAAAVASESSYSVGAWVRLDHMNFGDSCAFTAVSQGTSTSSSFCLGLRRNDELLDDSTIFPVYHWCFCVASIDSAEKSKTRWQKAFSAGPIGGWMLNRWVFLVGTCDVSTGKIELMVPTIDDFGTAQTPLDLRLHTNGEPLQIGRAKWSGRDVDFWPGAVADVYVWSGVVTIDEIQRLHHGDPLLND